VFGEFFPPRKNTKEVTGIK